MRKLILENNCISINDVKQDQIVICKWKFLDVECITKLCRICGGEYYWLDMCGSIGFCNFADKNASSFHEALNDAVKWNQKSHNDEFDIFIFDSLKDLGEWLVKLNG